MGSEKLVYFIDDINMPALDTYGTQTAIELLSYQMQYGGWYDRRKLVLQHVKNVSYVTAINPAVGVGMCNPRFISNFATFAVQQTNPVSSTTHSYINAKMVT